LGRSHSSNKILIRVIIVALYTFIWRLGSTQSVDMSVATRTLFVGRIYFGTMPSGSPTERWLLLRVTRAR